jgi:hypothetical protein
MVVSRKPTLDALGAESVLTFEFMRFLGRLQTDGALPVSFDVNFLQSVDIFLGGLPRSLDKSHAIHPLQGKADGLL